MSNHEPNFDAPFGPAAATFGGSVDPRFAHLPPPPAHPPAPPQSFFTQAPAPSPAERRRRVEIDMRNMVLALGVASLVAAAVSFCAVNWDDFDAMMRASLLLGVTALSVGLGEVAVRRGLGGTARALSWLTMVLGFVDVFALERAARDQVPSMLMLSVGAGVLFVFFAVMVYRRPDAAMTAGASGAWMLAWWSGLIHGNVTGADLYVIPLAVGVGILQWRWTTDTPDADSWQRYGLGLAIAAVPAVLTALEDPHLLRPLVLIAVVTVVLLVGLWRRQLAMTQVAGASLAVLVAAQLFEVLRGVPGWAVFALVGVVLLGVGAGFEYRTRRSDQPV